ncbi:MAG: hypothetical protein M1819_004139 [Sarea resinae]|nr:MAG: hypothetical protein M1819_004139 [Sarea resinae]
MKLIQILGFAAVASAFVIPDEEVSNQLVIESENKQDSFLDKLPSKDGIFSDLEESFSNVFETSKHVFDDAIASAIEGGKQASKKFECMKSMTAFDAGSWLDSPIEMDDEDDEPIDVYENHPPHHKPGKGHHGHHGHHKPNLTVYELIAKSKYTTKLAELINEDEDLVKLLNGTTANFTIFAPTDKAFAKIPKHAHKPSKEIIKKILSYHVSPEFYPAGKVLITRTIPTLLKEEALGSEPLPQRLATNIGLRGLTVNFYSRIIAVDIFGTNGVIHGVDSLIVPPPTAAEIVSLLPGEFSTLTLGLDKTGLLDAINNTEHAGGTLFAPSNFAFRKLGPKINAFLFSRFGEKYLKALLKYHIVGGHTLYSDAYYQAEEQAEGIPKGYFHVDLPTLLEDRSLAVDVSRYGRLITIKINGFSKVAVPDGIAKDGVIHVISSVLIPPKKVDGVTQQWQGEEITEEDLMERLEPYMRPELK